MAQHHTTSGSKASIDRENRKIKKKICKDAKECGVTAKSIKNSKTLNNVYNKNGDPIPLGLRKLNARQEKCCRQRKARHCCHCLWAYYCGPGGSHEKQEDAEFIKKGTV